MLTPCSIPSFARLAIIGASAAAAAGGFSFIRFASSAKYSLPESALTCSRGGVFISMLGSTLPADGVDFLPGPYAESGVSLYLSCSAWTAL